MYDYWLGGKDNYEAGREAAKQVVANQPGILATVRANRAFLRRPVQYLAGEAGIRQFLDIGTGLPASENTTPEGATAYVQADARDAGTILREAASTLDLSQPAAVMMLGLLHYISDADHPHQIVSRLMDGVAARSYLAISEAARDIDTERVTQSAARYNTEQIPAYAAIARKP